MPWRLARHCTRPALVVRGLNPPSVVGDLLRIVNDHFPAIVQRTCASSIHASYLPFGIWSVSTVRFPFGSPSSLENPSFFASASRLNPAVDTLTLQNGVHASRSVVLKRRQDATVRVQRERYLRVSERLHDDARVDTLGKQQRRARMTES
jgi:hypothetical protein